MKSPKQRPPRAPPARFLTETDTAFLIDDSSSALKQSAEQGCARKLPEDASPQAKAECVQKARDKFAADVLTFQASPEGALTLTIYRRKASRLEEVFSVPVEIEDSSDTTALVKPKGRGRGQRPFFTAQREIKAEVPDNYSLVLEEPRLGKLVYRVKIGLVDR